MQRVALIYNPYCGQHSPRREATIAAVIAELRNGGADVTAIATESPTSAEYQTRDAVLAGYDTILACGGDGTVHEVLQSMVGNPDHNITLGVIPMGTANALAANLGLPNSPVKAVRHLMRAQAVTVSVGRVHYHDKQSVERSRYFIVAAGIGADALFLSRLDSGLKRRFGYIIYVIEAARLWATHHFPIFSAHFHEHENAPPRVEQVSQLLAVRIRSFGGVLNELAPGAALLNRRLRLIAFKTRSRLRYMRFLLAVIFARHTFSDVVELVIAHSVDCHPLPGSKDNLYIEADGELLGTLPARIEVVQHAVRLLVPEKLLSRASDF